MLRKIVESESASRKDDLRIFFNSNFCFFEKKLRGKRGEKMSSQSQYCLEKLFSTIEDVDGTLCLCFHDLSTRIFNYVHERSRRLPRTV